MLKSTYVVQALIVLVFSAITANSVFCQNIIHIEESNRHASSSLCFTENKGQISDQYQKIRPDVLFSGSANDLVFHLRKSGISFQQSNDQLTYRTDIEWLGINDEIEVERDGLLKEWCNYYLPICPDGVTKVRSYQSITYQNIYPGISLKWYDNGGSLEFDFELDAGADPNHIKWQVNGSDDISINDKNEVTIITPLGKIVLGSPKTLQNGNKIPTEWTLNDNVLGVSLEEYNQDLALIIDPVVRDWSTYYGGIYNEYVYDTEMDDSSNIYIAGSTFSNSNIATSGAHQSSHGSYAGGSTKADAFVVKFSSSGIRKWATYYGGSDIDNGYDLAIDGAGNIYLTGNTLSDSAISTSGAHQQNRGGNWDGFLVKFNNHGIRQWGTYYGGTNIDQFEACAIDASSNVYVVGSSASLAGISTTGAHQVSKSSGYDGMIVKFDSSGNRQWGTYYGGTGYDYAYDCAVDGSGNLGVVGTCASSSGIATTGAHQTTYGANDDAFVVKFNAGGTRQWATYYGGSGAEDYYHPACTFDAGGNIYLVGTTNSTNNLSSTGAHQTSRAGSRDGFMAKFNSTGTRQWGTYFGGTGLDDIFGICISQSNNIYITGSTRSTTGVATSDGYQTSITNTIQDEVYFSKFNANGVQIWGSYYGYSGNERGHNVIKSGSMLLISGVSNSTSGMSTFGSHQTSIGGANDGFITMFSECEPDSIGLTKVSCDSFVSPSGKYVWNASGTYIDTLSNTSGCDSIISVDLTIFATPTITSAVGDSTCDSGSVTLYGFASAGVVNWYADSSGGTKLDTGNSYSTPGIISSSNYYVEATNNGCTSLTRSVVVATVISTPQIISTTSASRCDSGSVNLSAIASSGIVNWYTTATGGSSIGIGNTFTTPVINTTTNFYMDASFGGCISVRNVAVAVINQSPQITSSTPGNVCDSGMVNLSANSNAGILYWYDVSVGGISLGTGTSFSTPVISTSKTYYVEARDSVCSSSRIPIIASILNTPSIISTTPSSVCDQGSITLGAQSSAGIINWYDTIIGGTSIGIGSVFQSPSLSITKMYYVDASDSGCVSGRTGILATVLQSTISNLNETACFSYTSPSGKFTYTVSGNYSDTLINSAGCDSVLMIALTIDTVDTEISFVGKSLLANASGGTYQWINCDDSLAISGATQQSFEPTENGSYACIITQNNCTDTSDCMAISWVGLMERLSDEIQVYPNPSDGHFIISHPDQTRGNIQCISNTGSLVFTSELSGGNRTELNLPNSVNDGVYMLRIETETSIISKAVVIKRE